MIRRNFLQLISGLVLTAAIRPWEGFGLGQTELESDVITALPLKKVTSIIFPQATGNWGPIYMAYVRTPVGNFCLPIDGLRDICTGDQVKLHISASASSDSVYLDTGCSISLMTTNEQGKLEEVTGPDYKRYEIKEDEYIPIQFWE